MTGRGRSRVFQRPDLAEDPAERTNRIADKALKDVRARLRDRLVQRLIEAGEPRPDIDEHPAATPP